MTLKVTVIGNLTRDAEMRYTQQQDAVVNFTVARNDRRTKEASYVDCSLWGKLGQSLEPYLKKGQKVYVEGELGTREYNGKTYLTCRVRDIELVGSSQQRDGSGYDQGINSRNDNGGGYPDDEIPF